MSSDQVVDQIAEQPDRKSEETTETSTTDQNSIDVTASAVPEATTASVTTPASVNVGEFNYKLPFTKISHGQYHMQIYANNKEEADALVKKLIDAKLYTEYPQLVINSETNVTGDVVYRDKSIRRRNEIEDQLEIQEEILQCLEE